MRLYLPQMAIDPFGQAEVRYHDLVAQRQDGTLDGRAFRAAVRDMRVRDHEGREWMLGPGNGLWYRRERDRWSEARPPRRLVCPACGHHNLLRHGFCTECGGQVPRPD
jgi:hypothetical protein